MHLLIKVGGKDLLLVTDTHCNTVLHQVSLKGHVEVVLLLIGV